MAIRVRKLPQFEILYNLPEDTNTIVLIGGRGGGKTYEASKWIAFQSTIKKKRCVVLRDEKELIRESILNEVLARFDTANASGRLDQNYQKLDTGIRDRSTGEMLVFTKGFRASNNSKQANMKSVSNIDYAVIEEAEDIRDVEKFNTFADSIRNEGSKIVIILNTPDIGHWIIKRYFNTRVVEDGYYEIIPKELPGFVCVKCGFEDNPYLPPHVVSNYNGYGDPAHHLYNKHYYLTAIKGYASSGRRGQILTKVKPIKLADYLALPGKEYYGQDFGTAKPAALVGVKFNGNKSYCRELNYLPMNKLQLGILYCQLGFGSNDKIVADCADKKAIDTLDFGFTNEDADQETLQKYPQLKRGFFMERCVKGPDSVRDGLDTMDSMELYAVEESTNLWDEINNRVWNQDKYGNYTNEPKPGFDHLIDGWMYVIQDRNKGDYALTRAN